MFYSFKHTMRHFELMFFDEEQVFFLGIREPYKMRFKVRISIYLMKWNSVIE